MVEVKVMVNEDRLAEFYSMCGRWMADETPAATGTSSDTLELLPWFRTAEDITLATELWVKLPERAKAMVGLLIDSPGTKFSAIEIGSTLDIPHGPSGVAGVLAWPGRYSAAMGKKLPVLKEDGEIGQGANYWIERSVAELFTEARSNAE